MKEKKRKKQDSTLSFLRLYTPRWQFRKEFDSSSSRLFRLTVLKTVHKMLGKNPKKIHLMENIL